MLLEFRLECGAGFDAQKFYLIDSGRRQLKLFITNNKKLYRCVSYSTR